MNESTRRHGLITLRILTITCLFALAQPAPAVDIPPHIAAAMQAEDRWARDRKRDQRSKPGEVLAFAGVEPGMHVLDLYTGGGYWAEVFARSVGPTGTVVAQTNTAYRNFAGPLLTSRFKNNRIAGVTVLDSEVNDLKLGQARFDLIFIALGYHDNYYYADFWPLPGRERWFAQLYEALKPGGHIVIVDHAALAGTGNTAAQKLHRIDEDFAIADFERAGFELVGSSDVLRNAEDDRKSNVFDDHIRRQTDRFILRFVK